MWTEITREKYGREGLRYAARTPEIAVPLAMMGLVGMLAYEFQVTLPYMAAHGLHVGSAGYGFMTAAMGVGAAVGGLWIAARGKIDLHIDIAQVVLSGAANFQPALLQGGFDPLFGNGYGEFAAQIFASQ